MATRTTDGVLRHLRRLALEDAAGVTDGELLTAFVHRRDDAALAALVRRHGPMVWGVCRRLLRSPHDAEDAFQATFLVLVRKAASIRDRKAVANWLYGVARQTAVRLRAMMAKRHARERQVRDLPEPAAREADPGGDLQALLDQELSRLPDKYRVVLVLCDLEGRTRKEAARLLGCPEGTVGGRLARARSLLARRLSRHGVAVAGGTVAALLARQTASAGLPATVASSTIEAASRLAAGPAAAGGAISARAAALAEGVVKAMLLTRLKTATAVLAMIALVGAATTTLAPRVPAEPPDDRPVKQEGGKAPRAADDPPRARATPAQGRLEGRFTAADTGKPVAGARVNVLIQGLPGKAAFPHAESDADGRYALEVPLGDCNLWGVLAPTGYYIQDPRTFGAILTTAAEPRVVRDFVLQPGAAWRVELRGVPLPADPPPSFSALRDPERQLISSGEGIQTTGDARGKAVLTIPHTGGRYRFAGGLATSPSRFDFTPATLEIDQDFDPRRIQGAAEPVPGRKAVRLRDAAGRTAVVEGAEVAVEAGQAVLRFPARPIPTASAFALRGTVVDENGKPVAGAKATAAFATGRGGAMSGVEGTTDARGKFELPEVLLPQSMFDSPDRRVSMIVTKSGFDGAQTKELKLSEVKRAGSGDFGTVVLKPGHTLRGKVVDENGRPVHGAVVTNLTNYFLYSHLRCRTDAEGRFAMPDLSFGNQKLSAQYGERGGETDFAFEAKGGECVITVRLTPKSGIRPAIAARPHAVPLARTEGSWDLTPPLKEPKYRHEPRYALLVFGPKREQRVWMVLDGTTLYVDRDGNGDVTEPGERLEPNNPKDGSNRFAGSGSHTHFDVFEFTVRAGTGGTSKLRLQHWIRAEHFTPATDFDKKLYAKWQELHWENATLWRQGGQGQGQTPVLFMPKPADAQVCALDGPLTFVVKLPEYQVLQRGEAGCDLSFHIAVMGRPARGAEQQCFNPLATGEVPATAHLEVEIEYPAKAANVPPPRRKYLLKQRC